MFACRGHWYALPKKIRDAIWLEYRPGQEDDKSPSARYMAVQRLACANLALRFDQAADAVPYLIDAVRWRRKAIKDGLGDPLEGLVSDGDKVFAAALRKAGRARGRKACGEKERL
jgi:predicted transcriptional regulator